MALDPIHLCFPKMPEDPKVVYVIRSQELKYQIRVAMVQEVARNAKDESRGMQSLELLCMVNSSGRVGRYLKQAVSVKDQRH